MLELGIDCSESVRDMFADAGYTAVEIIKDYAGIERIISARK